MPNRLPLYLRRPRCWRCAADVLPLCCRCAGRVDTLVGIHGHNFTKRSVLFSFIHFFHFLYLRLLLAAFSAYRQALLAFHEFLFWILCVCVFCCLCVRGQCTRPNKPARRPVNIACDRRSHRRVLQNARSECPSACERVALWFPFSSRIVYIHNVHIIFFILL